MAPGRTGAPDAHRIPSAVRDDSRAEPGAHPSPVIAGSVGPGLRGPRPLFAGTYGASAAEAGGGPGPAAVLHYRVAGGLPTGRAVNRWAAAKSTNTRIFGER